MAPNSDIQHSLPLDDYGLDAIARHNAVTPGGHLPSYPEDFHGLGIPRNYTPQHQERQSSIFDPPTPRSIIASEGIRTRSGRSTRRTDSPFSTTKSRTSKSPTPRRNNKKKKADKSKTPKLTAPLSVLTKDCPVPVRDIEAYVNRSTEERQKEMEKKGYTSRPMNSFMLYRSAFAERTKAWCAQNNHQVVSSLSGESWPMEPDEIRSQFDEWAKIERQHHQEAHPSYKFTPSKPTIKRRKGDFSDDEDESSDLERNPDSEYRGARNVRNRRHGRDDPVAVPSTVGFDSHPYFSHHASGHHIGVYDQSQYQYPPSACPLPSNIAYDQIGAPYKQPTVTPWTNGMCYEHLQYQPPLQHDMHPIRVSPPASFNGRQSLGGYGLPGGLNHYEELRPASPTSTPLQQYQMYGHPVYRPYQTQYRHDHQPGLAVSAPQWGYQLHEHQQYLQQALQPEAAIEPSLQTMDAIQASDMQDLALANGQFDDATLARFENFYEPSSSPMDVNATLAPTWLPTVFEG